MFLQKLLVTFRVDLSQKVKTHRTTALGISHGKGIRVEGLDEVLRQVEKMKNDLTTLVGLKDIRERKL